MIPTCINPDAVRGTVQTLSIGLGAPLQSDAMMRQGKLIEQGTGTHAQRTLLESSTRTETR
jgi:hypothetical protein